MPSYSQDNRIYFCTVLDLFEWTNKYYYCCCCNNWHRWRWRFVLIYFFLIFLFLPLWYAVRYLSKCWSFHSGSFSYHLPYLLLPYSTWDGNIRRRARPRMWYDYKIPPRWSNEEIIHIWYVILSIAQFPKSCNKRIIAINKNRKVRSFFVLEINAFLLTGYRNNLWQIINKQTSNKYHNLLSQFHMI